MMGEIHLKNFTEGKQSKWKMTPKERISHIWMYYRGVILILLFIVSAVCYVVYSYASAEPEPALSVVIINNILDSETTGQIEGEAALHMGIDTEKGRVSLDATMNMDLDNEVELAVSGYMEQMTVEIFSHNLDIIIAPADIIKHYFDLGGLEDLQSILSDEDFRKYNGNYYSLADEGGNKIDCAISLEGTLFETKLGNEEAELMIAIVKSSERKEAGMAFLRYVFQ